MIFSASDGARVYDQPDESVLSVDDLDGDAVPEVILTSATGTLRICNWGWRRVCPAVQRRKRHSTLDADAARGGTWLGPWGPAPHSRTCHCVATLLVPIAFCFASRTAFMVAGWSVHHSSERQSRMRRRLQHRHAATTVGTAQRCQSSRTASGGLLMKCHVVSRTRRCHLWSGGSAIRGTLSSENIPEPSSVWRRTVRREQLFSRTLPSTMARC